MSFKGLRGFSLLSFLGVMLWSNAALASSYQYIRMGEKTDSLATPSAGTAMMGGGEDLGDAFRWLCKKANGGDFLILRAVGDDDYNAYVNGNLQAEFGVDAGNSRQDGGE
jgi:cyanophycinase